SAGRRLAQQRPPRPEDPLPQRLQLLLDAFGERRAVARADVSHGKRTEGGHRNARLLEVVPGKQHAAGLVDIVPAPNGRRLPARPATLPSTWRRSTDRGTGRAGRARGYGSTSHPGKPPRAVSHMK